MADVNTNVRPTYWWGWEGYKDGLSQHDLDTYTRPGSDNWLNGDWADAFLGLNRPRWMEDDDPALNPVRMARIAYAIRRAGHGDKMMNLYGTDNASVNTIIDRYSKLKDAGGKWSKFYAELLRLEQESEKAYNANRGQAKQAEKEKAHQALLAKMKDYGLNDKQAKAAAKLIEGYGSKSEKDKQRIREHFAKVLPRNVVAEDGEGGLTLRTLTGEEQEQKRLRALRFSDEDIAAIMAAQSAIDPNDPESVRLATEEVNARLGEGKSGLTATFNPETGTFAYARPKAEPGQPKFYTEQAPEKSAREKLGDTINMGKRLVGRMRGPRSEATKSDGRGVKPPQTPLERWRDGNERTFAEKAYTPTKTPYAPTYESVEKLRDDVYNRLWNLPGRSPIDTTPIEERIGVSGTPLNLVWGPEDEHKTRAEGTAKSLATFRDRLVREEDIREQTPFYGVTDDSRRLRVVDPGAVTAQGTFRYDYNTRKLAEQMRQQGLMFGETPSGAIVPVRIDENNQPQIVNARGFTPRDMMMRRPVETRSREQMMFDAMERAQATGQYNPRTAAAFARRLNNGTLNLPQLSNEQLAARERWRTAELARQAGGGQRAGAAMQLQMENAGTMWARQQAANPRMENPYEAAYRQQQAAFAARQRAAEEESRKMQAMYGTAVNIANQGLPKDVQSAAVAAQNTANPKQPTAQRSPSNPL